MGTLGAAGTGEDAGLASAGGTEETQLRVLACCCAARCKRCVLCLPSLSLQYELWNMKNRNLKVSRICACFRVYMSRASMHESCGSAASMAKACMAVITIGASVPWAQLGVGSSTCGMRAPQRPAQCSCSGGGGSRGRCLRAQQQPSRCTAALQVVLDGIWLQPAPCSRCHVHP